MATFKLAHKVDRRFHYVPAIATDLAKTFARVRRRLVGQTVQVKKEARREHD